MSEMPLSQQNVAAIGSASPLRLDLATVCGLAAGFGLLAVAIALGGSMASFVDLPSVLIVMGGTFAVVTICFSFTEVQTMLRVVAGTTLRVPADPGMAAIRTLQLAELARRNGPIHLEKLFEEHTDTPFLQKAIAMVVDGAVAEELEEVLHHDLHAGLHRIKRSSAVLRRAADYAPAMGLIGTLIGLVQMLGHLDQPQQIGPAMAVALLTTFYGAVLANMVFSPLAVKLECNARTEEMVCLVYLMGAVSISRQENPRRLELLINSVLPPAQRVRYFD